MILTDARVLVDGFDVSADHNSVVIGGTREMKDDARFGADTRIFAAGVRTWQLETQGFYRAALDAALDARMEFDEVLFTAFAAGAAVGDPGYALPGVLGEYNPFRGAQFGEQLMFSLRAMARRRRLRCRLLATGAKIASGSGADLQLVGGVPAGKKVYGGLHVTAVGGVAPTLDAVIESDDNAGFLTPTTRLTFAQKSAIGAEFVAPLDGPIADDRFRLAYTIAGAGSSFTIVAWMAVQ